MTTLIGEEEMAVNEAGAADRADHRDASQMESVYRRYGARVYSLCLRLLADVEMAESATVNVFVLLSRELGGRREESRLLSDLRELAIGTSLAQLRERSGAPEPPAPSAVLPSSALANAELPLDPARLDALIARLPDAWRIAFVLHDVEGLSDTHIAARLRTDTETVRRRVRHARLELRQIWRFRETGETDEAVV